MPELSKITLPSGTTYDIKDTTAREAISALSQYTKYLGVTTTALSDGAITNPIVIGGKNITATTGGITTYQSKEFIWNGSAWQEFGDLSGLGEFAFVDTGTATYKPTGTVSQPTFTGSSSNFTGTFTPSGSVSLTNTNKTATVSKANSGTATYTPEGSVSTPTITVTPSTTTINNPTSVTVAKTITAATPGATAPENAVTYYSVNGETLSLYQIGYTTGASITTSNVTVATGITSATASQPTFTGVGARLVTDNISVPSSAEFTGTQGNVSVSGTPSGTVSQPTFTGTQTTITINPNS